MKLPDIPIPEPVFLITLSRGSSRIRRAEMHALHLLLWLVPSCAAEFFTATAGGERHSPLLVLAAAFTVLAVAVLTVNVREEGPAEDAEPAGREQ